MFQLSLQFSHSKEALRDCLERMTGRSVSLIITDNSTSMITIRKKIDSISVRLHRMFLKADEGVIREITGFIAKGKGRTPCIRKFIDAHRACLKKRERSRRPGPLCAQGKNHNLREILDTLNQEYFEGAINVSIGWGKGNSRRVARKRTLGTYCRDTGTIRINPVLDKRNVPHYFISYVIYHEMLHSVVRGETKNGRRSVHTAEFRNRERLFKEYGKAKIWEQRHCP